jgi:hypothetical protein
MREANPDKLNELVGKLVGDLGAAIAGASILLGDRLGLYKARGGYLCRTRQEDGFA